MNRLLAASAATGLCVRLPARRRWIWGLAWLASLSWAGKAAAREAIVGALDPSVIRRVIERNQAHFRDCAEQASGGVDGKLLVEFTVGNNGRVSEAHAKSSTLGEPAVEQCMVKEVKALRFPRMGGGGGILRVTYPWIFER